MDPNTTLALILAKLLRIRDDDDAGRLDAVAAGELADEALTLIENLGAHLRKGGGLPDEWNPRLPR